MRSAGRISKMKLSSGVQIDHEGIVRYRSSGMGWEHSVDLDNAVKKHVKIVAKSEAANLP